MCGILGSFACRSAQCADDLQDLITPTYHRTANGRDNLRHEFSNLEWNEKTSQQHIDELRAGIDVIKHRGPDGSGVWMAADASVGLAHCRLSIIDPSPSGAQPLHCDENLVHAVVNGEIYDHDRLRDVCATEYGYVFSSHSDSELIIALYKIFGLPGLFEHLRGEFAFVLYDERENKRKLIAARDRFGIKPLFYTVVGSRILFASEVKAFLPMGWQPEWNMQAIATMGWMIDDSTIFQNAKKVMPGHWLEISDEQSPRIQRYWEAEYPDKAIPEPRTVEEMVSGVRERLLEAVRIRLRADVPVGIYLSGGIDSSAIAGMVTELVRKDKIKIGSEESTQITCFTIKFPHDTGYNESDVADRTAEWLGIKIAKLDIDEQKLADSFSDAVYHSEHHHFDLNWVAKFALSTLPGKFGVKAVLTGEGSDEHFSGYLYFLPEFLREPDMNLPDSILAKDEDLRENLQRAAAASMSAIWRSQGLDEYKGIADLEAESLDDFLGNTMPNTILTVRPSDKLFLEDIQKRYMRDKDMREAILTSLPSEVRQNMRQKWHPAHTAMHIGNKTTFPNVLLSCLGDRTEMAHSIEARTPFLDHHLTEYVNMLPPSLKLKYSPPEEEGKQGNNLFLDIARSALSSFTDKWILREAVRPYITEELYNRRKFPFLAPARWPKDGPLHNMFRELLTPKAVDGLGFIDYTQVQKALEGAFGSDGSPVLFRTLCYTASWVVLSEKFGMKKVVAGEQN